MVERLVEPRPRNVASDRELIFFFASELPQEFHRDWDAVCHDSMASLAANSIPKKARHPKTTRFYHFTAAVRFGRFAPACAGRFPRGPEQL